MHVRLRTQVTVLTHRTSQELQTSHPYYQYMYVHMYI